MDTGGDAVAMECARYEALNTNRAAGCFCWASWLALVQRLARSLDRCNSLLGSVHADESGSAPQNLHVAIKFGSESFQLNR